MQNNNDIIVAILTSVAAYFVSADIAKPFGQIIGVLLAGSAGAAYYIGRGKTITALRAIGMYFLLVSAALTTALPLVELFKAVLLHLGINFPFPESLGMLVAFLLTAFPQHVMGLLLKLKEKAYGKFDKPD